MVTIYKHSACQAVSVGESYSLSVSISLLSIHLFSLSLSSLLECCACILLQPSVLFPASLGTSLSFPSFPSSYPLDYHLPLRSLSSYRLQSLSASFLSDSSSMSPTAMCPHWFSSSIDSPSISFARMLARSLARTYSLPLPGRTSSRFPSPRPRLQRPSTRCTHTHTHTHTYTHTHTHTRTSSGTHTRTQW
jgi:hypothetical protein